VTSWPPPIFAVEDPAELAVLLANLRLGTLISSGAEGFLVTHMPFVHDAASNTLRGHISGSNPHVAIADNNQVLVVFHQLDAYVTPALYPSKAIHGRVAPTWNYEFLNLHGRITWRRDPAWLRANLEALTDHHETPRDEPWKVSDAPADYTAKLLTQIVGVEIAIDRIDCRRKFSQNRKEEDRLGVIAGMAGSLDPNDQRMAAAMQALED
jgi:transcriptional regulator